MKFSIPPTMQLVTFPLAIAVVKPLFKHDKDLRFAACGVVYE